MADLPGLAMADVFVSYARSDKERVAPLVAAIEDKGWSVWWDPAITPGQEFDERIDAELDAAKAVLVVWTPMSVVSRWVRGEAREAADRGILVPVRFEHARLPMDARAIHTIDFDEWDEDPASPELQQCLRALGAMIERAQAAQAASDATASASAKQTECFSICVLPFINMSGEPEQEYFSDGITEDITTDLSKVSALTVVSSSSTFTYKGKHVDIRKVVRELKVSHVLEGSVRKAGGRIRINAQLVNGTSNQHVWAERYDRDISDIFAIQDEISQAIVKALKLRLLPDEKKAIERHGTKNVEAHDLYLMARQIYVTNREYDERSAQAIVRMCTRATEIDPRYAQAWALLAMGYRALRGLGVQSDDGMAAAEKALLLNFDLAEAHAVKAYILLQHDDTDAAGAEAAIALELDPDSYEANRTAAHLNYQLHRYEVAIPFFENAVALMEKDINSTMMLISCHRALGDATRTRHAAEMAHKRAEALLTRDATNSTLLAYSAYALAALGEDDRAKARMNRSLMTDPDNFNARYHFACALSAYLNDKEAALGMLESVYAVISRAFLPYAKSDPDFEFLHDDPRYRKMVAAAEARLATSGSSAAKAVKDE